MVDSVNNSNYVLLLVELNKILDPNPNKMLKEYVFNANNKYWKSKELIQPIPFLFMDCKILFFEETAFLFVFKTIKHLVMFVSSSTFQELLTLVSFV